MTQTIRRLPRARRYIRQLITAFERKLRVSATGEGITSGSCQIGELKRLYADLQLPKTSGWFVEIGGYDGETFSNTSFLADQGWRGVYAEPVPFFTSLIRVRHIFNRVKAEQVAIGSEFGSIELHVMDALTTSSNATKAAYGNIDWGHEAASQSQSIKCNLIPLTELLKKHNVPVNFDLLVVDVEGAEEPIIDCLLASSWRPKVMIIELNDNHRDFASFPELQDSSRRIRAAIISAGYHPAYIDEINTVFRYGSS